MGAVHLHRWYPVELVPWKSLNPQCQVEKRGSVSDHRPPPSFKNVLLPDHLGLPPCPVHLLLPLPPYLLPMTGGGGVGGVDSTPHPQAGDMTKGKKCPHLEFCTAHDGYCLSLSNVFQGRRCSFPLVAASCHQMPPRGSAPVASMRVSQSSSNVCKCGCDPGRSSGDGKLAVCLLITFSGAAAAGCSRNTNLGPRAGEDLSGFQPTVVWAAFFTQYLYRKR